MNATVGEGQTRAFVMQLFSKKSFIILSIGSLAGCASPERKAEGPVLEAATKEMIPHFECALYHDQFGESEKITKGIDDASTIGENNGLSPGQIMGAYSVAKKKATGLVLDQAIQIASEDPDRLPRLDGTFPPPEPDDEKQAWKDTYEAQCASDDTAT